VYLQLGDCVRSWEAPPARRKVEMVQMKEIRDAGLVGNHMAHVYTRNRWWGWNGRHIGGGVRGGQTRFMSLLAVINSESA